MAIARTVADRAVTASEWEDTLEPLLARSIRQGGAVASPVSDALVRMYFAEAAETLRVDPRVLEQMRSALVPLGYNLPALSARARPTPAAAMKEAFRSNVTSPDRDFERIAQRAGVGGNTVAVSVLDFGFEQSHPAFQKMVWANPGEVPGNGVDDDGNGKVDDVRGWDFKHNDPDTTDYTVTGEHGTHVAGIAGRGTDRVKVIPSRTFPVSSMVAAIDYAAESGARLVNMSFSTSAQEAAVLKKAIAKYPELLFVVAAGNNGKDLTLGAEANTLVTHQAANLLVVANADARGKRASSSNYGAPFVTHAARGTAVNSAVHDGKYGQKSGTSMAAPHVSNVAAKCLTLDPTLSPAALKVLLAQASEPDPAWTGRVQSGGVIDDARAYRVAAITGLVARGLTLTEAADRLGLTPAERPAVLAFARVVIAVDRPEWSASEPARQRR